jgi:hypothetical protein
MLKYLLMEGEAQYLTRKAFPNASDSFLPYTLEEKLYECLIEGAKPERYLDTLIECMILNAYLERAPIRRAS